MWEIAKGEQMLRQLLLTGLIIQLFNSPLQSAQPEDNFQTKTSTILIALDVNPALENLAAQLKSEIENDLQSEGYRVIFDANSDYPLSYDESFGYDIPTKANLSLDLEKYGNEIHVSVFPYTSPIRAISSVLETKYVRDSVLLFNNSLTEKDIEISSDLVTGMALYTLGACSPLQEYFQMVVNDTGLPTTSPQETLLKSINFYQGNCNLLEKNSSQAISQFQKALLYDGNLIGKEGILVGSAVNLAWTYIQVGEPQDALDLMTKLVNDIDEIGIGFGTQPMWVTRYIQRAEIYNLVGRYQDAINDLTTVVEMNSLGDLTKAHYYLMRGQTYILLYEWDNVLADYNKALELDPNYADAYYFRGVLKYSVLQTGASLYAEALTDFQKYLELAPTGQHAADAKRYATDIQTQLNALNG